MEYIKSLGITLAIKGFKIGIICFMAGWIPNIMDFLQNVVFNLASEVCSGIVLFVIVQSYRKFIKKDK